MNDMEKYLRKVSAGLYRLPENEKNEILREIQSHIYEAESRQEPVQVVLDKLGSPLKLAQSYVNIHSIDSGSLNFRSVLSNMAFFMSAGLSGVFVLPTLLIMTFTFLISAIGIVGYSIINLFIDLPGNIMLGDGVILTGFSAVIVALIVGAIFAILAYLSWWTLRKYLLFISQRYKKLRMLK